MITLIAALLITTSVLLVATGALFLCGSIHEKNSQRAIFFFITSVGGAFWSLCSGLFLLAESFPVETLVWIRYGITSGILIAVVGLLGFCLPKSKISTGIITFCSIFSTVLLVAPLLVPKLLNNSTQEPLNGFYIAFIGIISLMIILIISGFVVRTGTEVTRKNKNSSMIFLVALIAVLLLSAIFNMVFPLILQIKDFLWVGPLSVYILVLGLYFYLFTNRQISLRSIWLKRLSYVVIISTAIMVYVSIVFIAASLIFYATPFDFSIQVGLFAIIIAVWLAIIIVVVHKITASIRSLLLKGDIDLAYILNSINKFGQSVTYHQIATFLADHLHVSYVGILIQNRLYESTSKSIDPEVLKKIAVLKNPTHTVWQDADLKLSYQMLEMDLTGIAQLRTKNTVIGQILLGKPVDKLRLSRRDFLLFEMIFNILTERIVKLHPDNKK